MLTDNGVLSEIDSFLGRMAWRYDIRLLERAAQATCHLCAHGDPLISPERHEVARGVAVPCLARDLNKFMRSQMRIPLFPDPTSTS